MSSRSTARLGLLVSGFAISAVMALTPDVAPASLLNTASSTANTSITGANELVAQQGNGCERYRRPACNRPGRRSTHR
jgi:photosystem II stability/assembly factor-like uncharacterized protein